MLAIIRVFLKSQTRINSNPGELNMLSGRTIAARPPGFSSCMIRSTKSCSGGTLLRKGSRLLPTLSWNIRPNVCQFKLLQYLLIIDWDFCSEWRICNYNIKQSDSLIVQNAITTYVQGFGKLFLFLLSAHIAGGNRVLSWMMFPLPSLFITIFIFVALTRLGLMSNPKKFSLAILKFHY